MTTTSHGHHIPGSTFYTDNDSIEKVNCGDFNCCGTCKNEAAAVTITVLVPSMASRCGRCTTEDEAKYGKDRFHETSEHDHWVAYRKREIESHG